MGEAGNDVVGLIEIDAPTDLALDGEQDQDLKTLLATWVGSMTEATVRLARRPSSAPAPAAAPVVRADLQRLSDDLRRAHRELCHRKQVASGISKDA